MDGTATELLMRCACGELTLAADNVHPACANRVVCCCSGCQTFARRMDPELLDAAGGTERFQVSPARLSIRDGAAHLACMQQTAGGALRWYASCCDTPLGLTLPRASVPFVGLDVRRIDQSALDGELSDVLGPVRACVNSALRGDEARARKADVPSLLAMLWHLAPLTLRWWWRGEQRRSPFFDAETGRPVAEPARLYLMR